MAVSSSPMATSAGLLPFRREGELEVLIAHPGGPLWANKHDGAWSVIKGEHDGVESPEDAARREFAEETGWPVPEGELIDLGEVRQRSGKRVRAFAVEAPELDPDSLRPGLFSMRWAGRMREFPEIDQVRWCDPPTARRLLNPAQAPLVDRLSERIASRDG